MAPEGRLKGGVILLSLLITCQGQIFVSDISPLPYVFESDRLPQDGNTVNERYLPSVANGHIATNVLTDTIFINGLYTGYLGESYRARVQSLHSSDFNVQGSTSDSRRYSLDVRRAVFEEKITTNLANVTSRVYAHHYYNRLLVTEVIVTRQTGVTGDIVVTRVPKQGNESADLIYDSPVSYNGSSNLFYRHATISIPETNTSGYTPVHMYWTAIPDTFQLTTGENAKSWSFVLSLDQSNQSAETHFLQGVSYITSGTTDVLLQQHTDSWEEVWTLGSIEIDGDLYLYKVIYGCLYYLYSNLPSHRTFTPANQFYGISPGGLANGKKGVDYYGHVFWDMETWMYPSVLMLRPDLAREMLSYRVNGMIPAFERATSGGYEGTRFPWESAYTGTEVTPDVCVPCRENQQHITGDIGLASRQYVSATRNITWLVSRQSASNSYTGLDFILEKGRFWASRPTYNSEKAKYEINGVMPPDEYAEYVNNSVYTNIVASYATHYARYAACLSGNNDYESLVPDSWLNVVQNLVFPYNPPKRYHEEYEGYDEEYNQFTRIKQADVVLLGYPLLWSMPADVRANDLVHYEEVTDPLGPAMTWGMHSIGWLDVGNKTKADEMFNRSYQEFVREPFKIWTEVRTGVGAVNFLTGMGGFLQTLFFGYAGMRLHVEELEFKASQLPPGVTRLALRNVDYLGNVLDLTVRQGEISVYVVSDNRAELPLVLSINNQTAYELTTGLTVTVYQPFRIYTTKASGCPLPEDKINVDYSPVSSKKSYNIAREKIRSRDPTMRRKLTSSMH